MVEVGRSFALIFFAIRYKFVGIDRHRTFAKANYWHWMGVDVIWRYAHDCKRINFEHVDVAILRFIESVLVCGVDILHV